MGLLAVLNEVRGTKLSAKLRNAMAMYDLMKTNPALLSTDWTNADDSRNYLPLFRQVSQEPRPRHARASRRRRAEAIRAPTPATPARGTTGVCTPLPRSSYRAETRPAGRGFRAQDGLLAICAAFPSSGTKNRAPRSSSKPSRTNAFQRMANLRAEKFHSMTQTPEVKQRPRRTRSQHSSSLAWWASSQARNSCRLDAMFTLAGMAVPAPTSTTCISALRRSASRTKL